MFRCFERNQTDIVHTLQVVVKGLEEINKVREIRPDRATTGMESLKAALLEFAENPRSRELLQAVAAVYEEECSLPEIAKAHRDRAGSLERTPNSKSKQLPRQSALPIAPPPAGAGIMPSIGERPSVQSMSADFARKGTQAMGSSWAELQTKLENCLARIQRKMSNIWGGSAIRPLRLSKTIPPQQWMEFFEGHLTVQFSVPELKNSDQLAKSIPPKSEKDNPLSRADDLITCLDRMEAGLSKAGMNSARTQSLTPQMNELTTLIADVNELIRNGCLADAEAKLSEKQSEQIPSDQLSTLWSNLGLAFQSRHDNKRALSAYQKSVEYYSDNIQSWFNSGLLLQEERNFPASLNCYLKATALAPNQSKGWCNLGVLQYEMKDFVNSVESLRKSVELSPDYYRGWDNLATSLCAVNEYRGAERCCQRAIKLNPQMPDPYFKLGVINFDQGNFAAAEHNFFQTLKLQPGYPLAEFYLVIIMARSDRLHEAFQIAEAAVPPTSNTALASTAWSELGYGFYNINDLENSLNCYRRVLDYVPERASAWYDVGIVYHRSADLQQARQHYEQSTRLDPEVPQVWQSLSSVYQDLGEHELAHQAIMEVMRLTSP